MWTKEQINDHLEASDHIHQILGQVFELIKNGKEITEYHISEYIKSEFNARKLISDHEPPIVSFRENTSFIHYFPEKEQSKKMAKNSLIMIDLWARKNKASAPFSDVTWMAYYGQTIPPIIQEGFFHIAAARDKAIDHIKSKLQKDEMPTGSGIDLVARNHFKENNLDQFFLHSTGHSIGHSHSPHGRHGHLKKTNDRTLRSNLGYTIEPGLYFQGQFGIRSEIDFIIVGNSLKITTKIQDEITLIK